VDAFQQLITIILQRRGYWVRSGYKVELSKAEKRAIGRPSCPRWDLDVVAYKGASNELLIAECKSYLDSRGVSIKAFDPRHKFSSRFKLFVEPRLQRIVLRRLVAQLGLAGACRPSPKLKLCLVAGRIASEQDRILLSGHFKRKGWTLWDDKWILDSLKEASESGYEDDISAIVSKLILRNDRALP
jgi:hypothetical protein